MITVLIGFNQYIQDNIIDLDNRAVIYKRGVTAVSSAPYFEIVPISTDQLNDLTCIRDNATIILVRCTSTEQYEAFKMADDLVAILDETAVISRLDKTKTDKGTMKVQNIRREVLPELEETNLYTVGLFITLRWSETIDEGD